MTLKTRLNQLSVVLQGLFYTTAGILHFVNPGFFLQIVPKFLPAHLALVYLSGVVELIVGIGLWVPKTRRLAAWGIIALLLAVYPANIYMWWADIQIDGKPTPPFFHAIRLPLQFLLMYLAYRHTKPSAEGNAAATEG